MVLLQFSWREFSFEDNALLVQVALLWYIGYREWVMEGRLGYYQIVNISDALNYIYLTDNQYITMQNIRIFGKFFVPLYRQT